MKRPLYRKIEFWTDVETLWRRLESGWDWLGVSEEGEYVVGYPGRAVERAEPRVTIRQPRAVQGEHGVRIDIPLEPAREHWYESEERARTEFQRIAGELREAGGPAVALVQRIEARVVVEEAFVLAPPGSPSGRAQLVAGWQRHRFFPGSVRRR